MANGLIKLKANEKKRERAFTDLGGKWGHAPACTAPENRRDQPHSTASVSPFSLEIQSTFTSPWNTVNSSLKKNTCFHPILHANKTSSSYYFSHLIDCLKIIIRIGWEYKEKKEVKWAINLSIFLIAEEEEKKRRRHFILLFLKNGWVTHLLPLVFYYWFEVRFGIDSTSSRISVEKKKWNEKNYTTQSINRPFFKIFF